MRELFLGVVIDKATSVSGSGGEEGGEEWVALMAVLLMCKATSELEGEGVEEEELDLVLNLEPLLSLSSSRPSLGAAAAARDHQVGFALLILDGQLHHHRLFGGGAVHPLAYVAFGLHGDWQVFQPLSQRQLHHQGGVGDGAVPGRAGHQPQWDAGVQHSLPRQDYCFSFSLHSDPLACFLPDSAQLQYGCSSGSLASAPGMSGCTNRGTSCSSHRVLQSWRGSPLLPSVSSLPYPSPAQLLPAERLPAQGLPSVSPPFVSSPIQLLTSLQRRLYVAVFSKLSAP